MIYCIWWTNSTIISWCLLMTMLPDVGVNIQLFGIQKVPKLSAPSRFAKLAFPLNKRRFVYIAIKIYYLSICIINSIYQELYVYIYIYCLYLYIYIYMRVWRLMIFVDSSIVMQVSANRGSRPSLRSFASEGVCFFVDFGCCFSKQTCLFGDYYNRLLVLGGCWWRRITDCLHVGYRSIDSTLVTELWWSVSNSPKSPKDILWYSHYQKASHESSTKKPLEWCFIILILFMSPLSCPFLRLPGLSPEKLPLRVTNKDLQLSIHQWSLGRCREHPSCEDCGSPGFGSLGQWRTRTCL